MKKFYFLILILFLFLSIRCSGDKRIKQSKAMADKLLNDISLGKADNSFPEKYFPSRQTESLMKELKNKCDFANRRGSFINDYIQEIKGKKSVSFIYEYYLKCDSIRFVLTYNLGMEIELYEFKLESIKKDNPMITKPEKRLKI